MPNSMLTSLLRVEATLFGVLRTVKGERTPTCCRCEAWCIRLSYLFVSADTLRVGAGPIGGANSTKYGFVCGAQRHSKYHS